MTTELKINRFDDSNRDYDLERGANPSDLESIGQFETYSKETADKIAKILHPEIEEQLQRDVQEDIGYVPEDPSTTNKIIEILKTNSVKDNPPKIKRRPLTSAEKNANARRAIAEHMRRRGEEKRINRFRKPLY
jgi:hypothetical protein